MTSTPKSNMEEALNESWVEVGLGCLSGEGSNTRNTPIHFLGGGTGSTTSSILGGNIERLLWEAQRESSHSSAIGSRISSRKGSPKSPPNSPASETNEFSFLKAKSHSGDLDRQVGTEWIWDWSSRPDQEPPKDWKFRHPLDIGKSSGRLSLRNSKVVKRGLFSTEVLSVLVLTNIISLLVGAGVGLFLGKRFNHGIATIPLD